MLDPKLLIVIGLSFQLWDVSGHALPSPDHLAHKTGCFSDYTGRVHPFDVPIYPKGTCEKLFCRGYGFTEVHSCNKQYVPEGCYLSKATNERYPYCCPQVICEVAYVEDDPLTTPVVDPTGNNNDVFVEPDYIDPYFNRPRPEVQYPTVDDSPRVRRSVEDKPDNRGDDYKLEEFKTNNYDVKDVSSRRSPWNKNESV